MNYKTIGNTLTPGEFNAIQYLLNKNMTSTLTVNLDTNEITTEYGTLKLTYGDKHYKRKTGFITNNLKMKLTDPLIENMDFNVELTYKTLNNDLLDHDDDTTTTVTYNLPTNTEITITEATLDHIIQNNAELTITFNKPVMQKTLTLTLNGSEFWTANNETTDITATLKLNNIPLPNTPVTFKTGETITTETTDTNGVATYTYTGVKAGNLNYTVTAEGLTEHFRIYDAKFHNDTFYNHYSRITANDKSLSNSSGQVGYWFIDESGTATTLAQCYQYEPPFAILMRITEHTTGSHTFIYDGSHSFRVALDEYSSNQAFTVLIKVTEDKVEYYVDGELREDLTWEGTVGSTLRGGLQLDNGASVTYDDIYLTDITTVEPATITVSSDKDVLSYYDEDTATLTATVLDANSQPCEDETVTFTFKHDNTVIETQTADTDSSGVATVSYSSKGSGDLNIECQCRLLLETYAIEDCLITQISETTVTNSSGTKISSIGMDTIPNIQNTNFQLEFDGTGNGVLNIGSKSHWSGSSANYRCTIGYADNKNYWSVRTTSTSEGYGSSASTSTQYHYKIEREGNDVMFYVDDTLIQTKSVTFFTSYDVWSIYSIIWGSGTQKIKNIKLKPL